MLQRAGWPLLWTTTLSYVALTLGQIVLDSGHLDAVDLSSDLHVQSLLHQLRRVKRAPPRNYKDVPAVVLPFNGTGRCVLSADRASHYCGDTEVHAPPFPPPQAGKCRYSETSGREICYPRYEDLDTSCTDVGNGMVAPPAIKHATVRAMAFVPPDNLRRLIRQYYRQQGKPIPKNTTFSPNSFLFVRYQCEFGYELADEVDTMFCDNRQWVMTPPKCRGKGLCEVDNGGCSHSCLSIEDRDVECRCPKGMILDSDQKTCIKPIPKKLCRNLSSCSCLAIDENQYACTCPKGEKCLLLRGPPKIYVEPPAPYEIPPGGNMNITCSAVSYPFPQIFWQRGDEAVSKSPVKPGTVRSEQILIIKELYRTATFTCHANNSLGQAERTVEVIVTGPGSAPVLRGIDAGRTSVRVNWDPPVITNRPVTSYTVYYTNNGHQPIKNWKKINVDEPKRDVTIKDLRPHTQYILRLRANDKLGPGRLGNPVSLMTRRPAARPQLYIPEGEVMNVPPLTPFRVSCNVTRGDPAPKVAWHSRGRPINTPQKKRFITMEHGGLYESTNFSCVAENEAGKSTKRVRVVITGPSAPERIRYQIDGNNVDLQWEPPRIANGPMTDYEILYTDDPDRPEDEWQITRVGSPDVRALKIPNLREKTDYTFKIRGVNQLGPGLSSGKFTLTTWLGAHAPNVVLTPADSVVKDPSNEELVLECDATGVPKPKILWLWSGHLIEDGKDEFRIYDITPLDAQDRSNSKLIAEKTNRAGTATCQAVNPHGSDEKRTEVKILGPGSPPRDIKTATKQNGFTVSWKSPKYPNGKIVKYIVYYSKRPDDDLGDWARTSVDGDKREITITVDDEDTPYNVRVQAATKDGVGIISEAYDVTTGKKPIPLSVELVIVNPMIRDTDEETTVEPMQNIRFKCVAEGRPTPQILYSWLPFNETESGQEPVPIPAYSDRSKAHRYQSIEVDSSTATKRALMCKARNPDGTVDDRHIFNVIKPGSPPDDIKTIVDPDNHVTIIWEEPKHPNGPITGYKVYMTADPSKPIEQWQAFDVSDPNTKKIEFARGELEPEMPYYVKVAAIGPEGEGVSSESIPFDTVSGAPVDAPTDVLATVGKDNTVDISWTGPSVPNGPIESYTVYFTPVDPYTTDDGYKQWDKVVVPTNNVSGTIQLDKETYNILPHRQYKVRVTATNDLSEGPASETISFRTGSGETPPVIRLDPPNNPASVPPRGSISVRCSATGIPEPTVMWIIGTKEDVVRGPILQLNDLRKDETAICRAENNAGRVQEVLQVLVAGPGTPPNEVIALPMGNQQANVEWTTPDNTNGKVIEYIVHYGEIPEEEREPREWKTVRVPGEDIQQHRLTDLKPKTNYAVKVQAVSDRGPGIESDPVRLKTLPLAPAMIEPPKVNVHDNNTVAVKFAAPRDPENPAKPIKEFVVHYTEDDPMADDAVWKELQWTEPEDDFTVSIPIDGENFKPDTKYAVRVVPRGEIDGPPSEPIVFQTGDGIIPPEKPIINVDAPDNILRVPAGTDYTVSCSSNGFPAPTIVWIDENGNQLSDGPMLKLQDVKETVKAKCIAENDGGKEETIFEVFVTGPGNAPSNIRLTSDRPRMIHAEWDPPSIPNGNITRYIIFYTPLDDQNIVYQIGQVPKKPITEWMTYHKTGEKLNTGEQIADLTDFLEPDTAYAVVLQAANQDGPGPYSEQHTIRTMSRAREGPPHDLRVEPQGQRSANVEWKKPETTDQQPVGYELYYIKADVKIWEDDLASIGDWNKIPIFEADEENLIYHIDNLLDPDTEYVFKIRAIFPDGPGVFSEACITKTLPDGNAPYIMISNGDHGVEGNSHIDVLPGSALNIFCNATGVPQPSVKWIRSGSLPIDPSWIEADEKHARWTLRVANITEDSSFNCVAQSPLGLANWTINVQLIADLSVTWKIDFVLPKNENGEVALHFTDNLPDYLKEPNDWIIYWTDNPGDAIEMWNKILSDKRPLARITVPEMEPGTKYYLIIEQPSEGIKTPTFEIMTPKPASEIRVGTNLNGETVLDFKPAVAAEPIKKYLIKYWPDDDPSAVTYMETPVNVTDQIVIDGLFPDTDYSFMVSAKFDEGDNLPSEPVKIKTPSGDIQCDCAHACMFEEDEEGAVVTSCYCHSGFRLADDKKSCEPVEEEEGEAGIIQVTPPTFISEHERPEELSTTPSLYEGRLLKTTSITSQQELRTEILPTDDSGRILGPYGQPVATDSSGRAVGKDSSLLPTNEEGQFLFIPTEQPSAVYPTDEMGHEILPVVGPDGIPLATNSRGEIVDNNGNPINRDDDGQPIGPDGNILSKNQKGEWVYPVVGKDGQALPTDVNLRPIYTIVRADDTPFNTNADGLNIDDDGNVIPTDSAGRPVGQDGSPYPTDEEGRFVVISEGEEPEEIFPTDELGHTIYPLIFPDGEELPTDETGHYVDENGNLIPTNEAGFPIGKDGSVLSRDENGKFVYTGDYVTPTDASGKPIKVLHKGKPLKYNKEGKFIDPEGNMLATNKYGYPITANKEVLPTSSDGAFILPKRFEQPPKPSARQEIGREVKQVPIIGPNGKPLPTNAYGAIVGPDGTPVPTNEAGRPVNNRGEALPTDHQGNAIYPAHGLEGQILPTDRSGRPVYPVLGINGKPLPTDQLGAVIGPGRQPLPTNAAGVPINNRGEPLPMDNRGNAIYPVAGLDMKLGPTDKSGRPIYPVIGPDGEFLPTNDDSVVIDADGKPLPTNAAGIPVNNRGKPLPTDANGNVIYPMEGLDAVVLPTDRSGKPIHPVIGPDGEPLPTDQNGAVIAPDGRLIPTNAAGAPVNNRGELLPTDTDGYAIYPAKGMDGELLPTDINGRPVHQMIGPDGKLLPTDSDGSVVGPDGKPIPTNAAGVPVNNQGDRLPTDTSGTVIYPANGLDAELSPTDESGRPVYSVIGIDGQPLATDRYHAILGPDGEPIPTNAAGVPINNKGELLPTDRTGHIMFPIGGLDAEPLPTNKEGEQIHPVIGPDGLPLPTNSDGSPVAPDGEVIPTNSAGWPVDNEGQSMPTDVYGNVIYPVRLPDGSPLPTDKRGRPVYPVIGPDGQPLPTGESGGVIGIDGEPIPTNAAGKPIGEDSSPLPTDEYGRVVQLPSEEAATSFATDEYGHIIHPVVDADGFPLHRDEHGAYVSKDGKNVELNDQDLPVGPNGKVLPTDSYGNYIYPDVDEAGKPLPTDSSGRSIYTVIGPDGELFPTMSNGSILAPDGRVIPTSASGKPLGPDSSPLPTDARGRILYPKEPLLSTSKPTDASGRIIFPIVDRYGRPLTTDESGQFLDYDGQPLETDVYGRPLDSYGQLLPVDENGHYVYDAGKPVFTDSRGKPVYKIVDLKGEPLPTNAEGFFVKKDGQVLPTDRSGAPMETDGSPLPTDSEGNFLWPGETMEAAAAEKPYLIVTEEGETLPKDSYGRYLDPNGDPVRVNENGIPIRPNNKVMPTNAEGNYILSKADYVVRATAAKPTELLVIGPDGNLLPTDSEGAVLAPDGQPIPTTEDGTPLSEKGQPLPTDTDGKFVFQKAVRSSITPVEGVFGPDGELLPTDESGNYLSLDGRKIERDDEGKPLGPDGRILPTDEYGGYIYPVTGPDGAPLPTDKSHRPIYIVVGPDGVPLPTDESGVAVGPNGQPIPTNRAGRPLNAAGAVLPTDSLGHAVLLTPKSDCETKLGVMDVVIAINTESVDSEGFTHVKRVIRDLIDEYFDLAPDMTQIAVIKYSGTAEVPITLGGYNEKIELLNEVSMMQRDESKDTSKLNVGVNAAQQQFITFGRHSAGKLLIVITDGRDIYATDAIRPLQKANIPLLVIGKTEFEEEIKDNAELYIMVDEWPQLRPAAIANKIEEECVAGHIPIPMLRITGKPRPRPTIMPSTKPVIAVGPDGLPLPTDHYGSIIGDDGKPIPTDAQGKPVGPDGSPLPTDEQGNVMVAFEPTTTAAATDEYGHIIYLIKDLDGQPLPTDETGSSVNRLGERVEFDEIGKPVGPDRMPLPTDETGSFIYPAIDNSGRPLPTDENKRPLYPLVDANGHPLPTDEGGIAIDSEGNPIPTNAAGRPISPNGSPFPFDEDGNVVISEGRAIAEVQFPTDSSGHILYPVVWPDGSSLPTDDSGSYIDNFDRLVEIGDDGKPLDPSGKPLPTNAAGAFVFPQLGKDGNPLPTDENKRPIYPVVLPNGQPLPTDVSGFPLADDGRPFPTDNAGRPLSIRGETLPTNEDGNVVYSPKASATVAYPVIGPDGEPLPTDESGAIVDEYGVPLPIEVDKDGRPVGPDGVVLPTSAEGHYVYIPSEPVRTLAPVDTGTSVVATTITKQDLLPEEIACEKIDTPSNIIFVVESSEAVRKQHAEMMVLLLDFIENSMDLSKSNAGVIAYGGSVDISVDIGNYQNFDELAESIREIPIIGGGSSGDEHAMKTALQLFREVYNDGIGEVILHLHKTPSSHEAKTFIRHLKANETIALFDIGKGRWNRLRKADSASTSLRNQICTYLERRKISQTRKLEGGKTTVASPADQIGRIFYPIIGSDGQPLPTNSFGEPVDAFGKPISKDRYGRPLGIDGSILPTNKDGAYMYPAVGIDGRPLPTDVNKKPVYPVIDADGLPLPTDETGAVVGPDGKPIPTDTSGRPVDANGSPLPTDPSGKVVFIETTEAVKTLPTDEAGRVIHPIIGHDGEPLPTDRMGRPIGAFRRPVPKDRYGRPLGPNRKVLPTDNDGNYVYPALGPDGRPLPTDANKRPVYPVIRPDGRPLPTDEKGAVVGPDGKPIPTDTSGRPVDANGSPLPTDPSGKVIFIETTEAVKTLPTDEAGRVIHPIIGHDGEPLPTDRMGRPIGAFRRPVPKDRYGRPLGPNRKVLPTDDDGNYVYPALGPDGRPLPTDVNKRPVYPVVDAEGRPLPTDETGAVVGHDGEPIPTDSSGRPVGADGSPLPTDPSGNIVFREGTETVKTLPTDETGRIIYPIIGPDHEPLPTDSSGKSVDAHGRPISEDRYGRPLGPDGRVLPTDSDGNYVYPAVGPDGQPLPTDANKRPVYPVVDADGRPLPTDETGAVVGHDGEPIPTDSSGRPVGADGSPLPTDPSGNIVFREGTETVKTLPTDETGRIIYPIIGPDHEPLPTDSSGKSVDAHGRPISEDRYGRPLGPDGRVLPTDSDGNYVYPAVGPDGQPLPTDANKRPVYPVVDADGRPLPTDETGAVVGHDGEPIPTDSSGRPVGADGSPLPTDPSGSIIFREGTETVKTLPTDETGRIIYPIIGPDREPLPTDSSGKSVDAHGRPISEDRYGRPLGPDGRVLPTDSDGNYVYPAVGPDGQPLPTDANKRPVYPVVDADGRPLPTDETGAVVGHDGKPIPTDSWGRPIDVHGFPLPSDPYGNVVHSKAAVSENEQGEQTLYAVTRPDGEPLSTSLYGRPVDALGMLATHVGSDREVLPTDASGKFVYPAFGADRRPDSTSSYKKPVHFVVNAEGVILPTDEGGAFLDSSGQPIPTDSSGRPVGADGSQLPTDHLGNVIYMEATKSEKTLPTDSSGHVIFPVLGPDGQLMPTDESGFFVDAYGRPIPTDEMRRPVDSDKKILPTDSEGNYIRPAFGFDGRLLPTDTNKIPVYPIVDMDGTVLPTDDTGAAVDRHGKHLPTDASGIPLGRDGQPLPTDSSGRFVLKDSEIVGTTSAASGAVPVVHAVTGPDGEPLPTDLSGSAVDLRGISTPTDKSGYPVGPNGRVSPTETSGRYLYPLLGPDDSPLPTDIHRRPVYPVVGPDGHLLPTDESGTVIGPDGHYLPTDSLGRPVAADGSILPSDSSGRILFSEGTERAITLPTDENGDVIYRVTGPDGEPLSTSYFPQSPRSTLPYVILMPDGSPLPTDSSNNYIDENGVPIPTDEQGRPLDPRGQPLKKDAAGNYLYFANVRGKPHKPTRKYDIVYENGFPLPTDFTGHFLDENALPIPTDAQGYPVNDAEHIFERKGYGRYVYKPKTTTKDLLEEMTPITSASFTTSKKSPYCTVNSNVDVLLLLDASANVRVVDYRIMKEFIENFLTDHFNLRKNRVRVGVLKYGDKVEVPLALGDYDNQAQLISKISETRRMRGSAHLSAALRDAAGEFLISGSTRTPKVAIVLSNGKSSDDPRGNARVLREDVGAIVYLVDAGGQGDPEQNLAVVGESNPHRIVSLNEWRGSDSEAIGSIADELCELLPQLDDSDTVHTWPARKTTLESERTTPARICTRIDYQSDVMFVLDSSDNFSPEQYGHLKEGLSTLIDETFDLSPDVVQVGLVEYSDKASVPVALGHYEDKVQLLTDIANSEQLFGEAILLKGLNAARQQFQLHGRKNVPRVLLLITNGVNRGNAANAAEDLRERYNVELFILAVNASTDAMRTLNRLAGEHLAHQKVIPLIGADKLHGSELTYIGRTLCGLVEPAAATIQPHFTEEYDTHRTTKRDVWKFMEAKRTDEERFAITPARLPSRTTRAFEPTALCKDGYLRPYQLSVVVDATARSTEKDLRLVLAHIANFVQTRFSSESGRMQLNLVTVDSDNVTLREPNFGVDVIEEKFRLVRQTRGDELSAKLGRGIDEAVMLATEHAIRGVNQIILVVSADGTSSDDAMASAEFARGHYQHNIIAVSIRTPASELLKELAEGSPTRVIHFSEWSVGSELFGSWLAHAICDYVTASTTKKIDAPYVTSSPSQRTTMKIKITEPTNVEATPLSPNSFSVSWTCCTNKKADYEILYTPDASLPKWQWQRVAAKCRDSFGKRIDKLPTDNEYTICVETHADAANQSAPLNLANCDTVQLNKDTTPPPDYEVVDEHTAPCQCVCTERGEAVVQPTCADVVDPFRPLTTLPPATEGECPCKVAAHSGRCPSGYFFSRGFCYDVNECQQQNGGCSHGCVNTPGDFYCACPHGMMRDPVNPKSCINVAGSFDRIAELLGQYLSANRYGIRDQAVRPIGKGKPNRYKATVKSADDRTISFEWSSMPAVVRRALKWLF
uniref:VWFA domain-containing protein n=1 Tax=Parascaris univalens TaxID=6257 RepID=A0A915BJG8_PARUN